MRLWSCRLPTSNSVRLPRNSSPISPPHSTQKTIASVPPLDSRNCLAPQSFRVSTTSIVAPSRAIAIAAMHIALSIRAIARTLLDVPSLLTCRVAFSTPTFAASIAPTPPATNSLRLAISHTTTSSLAQQPSSCPFRLAIASTAALLPALSAVPPISIAIRRSDRYLSSPSTPLSSPSSRSTLAVSRLSMSRPARLRSGRSSSVLLPIVMTPFFGM